MKTITSGKVDTVTDKYIVIVGDDGVITNDVTELCTGEIHVGASSTVYVFDTLPELEEFVNNQGTK